MLRIEQSHLAEKARVSLETLKRIEQQPGAISAPAETVDAIRKALEMAGVEFIDGDQPGVMLKASRAGEQSTTSDETALPGKLMKDGSYDGSPV